MRTLVDQNRMTLVAAKAEEWASQLIDLGPRNTLLHFKNTKQGSLDLTAAEPDALAALIAGKPTRISDLIADASARRDACGRARSLRRKILTFEEEQGVDIGRIAHGMLLVPQQADQGGTPVPALRAPLLLRTVRITSRTAADNDFVLDAGEDVEINQVLLYALDRQYGIDLDVSAVAGEIDAAVQGTTDPDERLTAAYQVVARLAATRRRPVELERSVVVGLFNYEKLPMVMDLRTATDLLAGHDLVAAMAGDEAADREVREQGAFEPVAGDDVPPADEFLVQDADSSQQRAITTALAGRHVLVEGPPGTGKSQTIANIIASAAARGQRVLFVAEKRAAIEAVTDRLARVGLDGLVFDLHHQTVDKRRVARQLQASLDMAGTQLPVDVAELNRRLVDRRRQVRGYSQELHLRREPWRISAYDVQAELLALSGAGPRHRFRQPLLAALDADTVNALRDDLMQFVEVGGLRIIGDRSPWSRAGVRDIGDAERVLLELDSLTGTTLRDGQSAMAHLVRQAGLVPPVDLPGWQQVLDLLDGVRQAVESFGPEVFGTQLDDWRAAVATGRERSQLGRKQSWSRRRELCGEIRSASRDGITRRRALHTALIRIVELRDRWQELGGGQVRPAEVTDLDRTMRTYQRLRTELTSVALCAQLRELEIQPTERIEAHLRDLVADQDIVLHLPDIHRLTERFRRLGLIELVLEAASANVTPDQLWRAFRHAWLLSLHDEFRLRVPLLHEFVADRQTRLVDEYRHADVEHRNLAAQRVRFAVARMLRQVRDDFPDETQLLRAQASRKSRHLPIRRLVERAPHVLLALRPCWAMSPLVVSKILPARQLFDLVVFDEASQIRPHDAITSMARGRTVVVAGDDRQLPPTNFFARVLDGPTDPDADDDLDEAGDLTDYESILSTLRPLIPRAEMLKWHYRSQDERLIAFANREIYDDQLVTFPGATRCSPVTLDVVDGVASPGQDGSAPAEVELVVRRVLEHAQQRPHESLGVITLGEKHMARVENAIRRAVQDRPDLHDFFREDVGAGNRFFVKNLERVQGDERDAIVLTIGVAKRASGTVSRTAFGPLNAESGRRRLNVAVTRAKRRMMVISSFRAGDIAPSTAETGTELLRRYLDYTAQQGANGTDTVGRPLPVGLNGFERDVVRALTNRGIEVHPQWGFSDYRIDFALAHRDHPGRMVLAVEADGDTYHRVYSTRDRDRLRQQHLENLGWRFHRVWSSAWFADRDGETDRIVRVWEAAMRGGDEPRQPASVVTPPPKITIMRGPRPPVSPGRKTNEYSDAELISLCRWLLTDRLQRDRTERIEEAMRELGFQRKGSRIVQRLTRAVDIAQDQADRTVG
ncbi:MAG TPA: AAA domain-containing protein [Pseudonocardiaceae bacterium]|nr:AAA domain-containing protein [Pseudonocardiaceae bacterium]